MARLQRIWTFATRAAALSLAASRTVYRATIISDFQLSACWVAPVVLGGAGNPVGAGAPGRVAGADGTGTRTFTSHVREEGAGNSRTHLAPSGGATI